MAACSLSIPELIFLSPQTTAKRRLSLSGVSLSKLSLSRFPSYGLRSRIRAVKEEGVVVEEREAEFIKKVNGVSSTSGGGGYSSNGSVNKYSNGSVGMIESENGASNGSLVKYVNGNGVAAAVVEEIEVSKLEEEGRQRKIEEIGKEDAWFKQSGLPKVEV